MLPNATFPAIYARYSSDLQNPSSVDDQIELCRQIIADQFKVDPRRALVYSDAAISGATITKRPGMIALLAAVAAGRVSMVIAEGLDRLSRSIKDIAEIHEILSYHGVMIWTVHEGRITELHVGLKGTMNALYLKDMKEKVRRGQKARVMAGFAPSACPYGYRVVRGVVDERGRTINGVREIDEKEAAIVRRIFQDFASGKTILEIVEDLNREDIVSPGGGLWKRNALAGSRKKLEGVLYNEIYIGNLVYNRTRIVREPVTGRRRYAPNPESEWTRTYVPELRIVDDALWNLAKSKIPSRWTSTKNAPKAPRVRKREPTAFGGATKHPLTGWVKCGWCGGPKNLANASRYICSTNRYAKKCKNARGTNEFVILAQTFECLQARVQEGPDFHSRFAQAFSSRSARQDELKKRESAIKARCERLLDAIEHGVSADSATKRIVLLEEELKRIEWELGEYLPPPLPDEATIRATLSHAIGEIERSDDIKRTRMMFSCLLKEIILTPVREQKQGETIDIALREEGWPDFWRMVTALKTSNSI